MLFVLEAGSLALIKTHEWQDCPIEGDSYMKINMDNCTSDSSQCEVRCDGTTSSDSMTSKLKI